MTSTVHSPFILFRFAVRESDWALAALLAQALAGSSKSRRRLELELRRAGAPRGEAPSLLGLRVLARLLATVRGNAGPGLGSPR